MLPCPRSSQPPYDSPTRSQPAKMPTTPQTSQRCFAHQSASSSQPNTTSPGSAYPIPMSSLTMATSVAAISLPDAIPSKGGTGSGLTARTGGTRLSTESSTTHTANATTSQPYPSCRLLVDVRLARDYHI